jgi:hypothetical protein
VKINIKKRNLKIGYRGWHWPTGLMIGYVLLSILVSLVIRPSEF